MDNSKKTASYKFNKNLLGLSNCKVLDDAKKEWDLLDCSKYEESKKCICQHKIKHCNFYLNNINGNMIIVGSACSKKFGLIQKETSKKSFPKPIIEIIKKGEYENIEDLFKYSAEVREIYIQYFKCKMKHGNYIMGGLRPTSKKIESVKEEVEELEKKYKINWLLDLKIDLIEKIKEMKELELKEERERIERKKKLLYECRECRGSTSFLEPCKCVYMGEEELEEKVESLEVEEVRINSEEYKERYRQKKIEDENIDKLVNDFIKGEGVFKKF